jgi:hypothetical protein
VSVFDYVARKQDIGVGWQLDRLRPEIDETGEMVATGESKNVQIVGQPVEVARLEGRLVATYG